MAKLVNTFEALRLNEETGKCETFATLTDDRWWMKMLHCFAAVVFNWTLSHIISLLFFTATYFSLCVGLWERNDTLSILYASLGEKCIALQLQFPTGHIFAAFPHHLFPASSVFAWNIQDDRELTVRWLQVLRECSCPWRVYLRDGRLRRARAPEHRRAIHAQVEPMESHHANEPPEKRRIGHHTQQSV